MTDTGQAPTHARRAPGETPSGDGLTDLAPRRPSGWVSFAGIMMILLGAFQVIEGLVALFERGYYVPGANGAVVAVSYTGWGWFHLLLGVLVLAAGFAVMAGRAWGRGVGVVLAVLSAIANLAFIAAYPLWSIVVITVDIVVIYALSTEGSRVRS